MTDRANRRLAAILAADVAGYTRLVQQDEEGTIAAWRACRSELIDPAIATHQGRIANTAGDSLLVEFRSAVDAARCALDIQTRLVDRVAEGPQIALRMGLTVGDVISDGDDLLGDGVNIAARLEQMADPGAVLVSAAFADQVRGRADVGFQSLGTRRLKNVAEPVEVLSLSADAGETGRDTHKRSLPRAIVLVAIVASLAIAGGLFWMQPWRPDMPPAQPDRMAYPLPDKPSVAVLPFSHPPEDASYLADGLTDDLITDLSKISGLFVIAGNSSFAYREASETGGIAAFAEALGVRYVIDGSLRRDEDGLRINVRLIDATTGRLLWADRYTGQTKDIFAIQTRLAGQIAKALDLEVPDTEMAAIAQVDTAMVEAREAFQQGWEHYSRFNEQDNAAAIPFFKAAVDLDPGYGRAYGALALVHLRPHLFLHWNAFTGEGEDLHIGEFYRYLNLAAEQDTSLIHVIRAMVHLNLRDWVDADSDREREALKEAALAIAQGPNDPEAHLTMAWALIASGEAEEGLGFVHTAMRLDPAYPSHYVLFEAAAHFAAGDLEQAAAVLQAGLERDAQAVELMPALASVLAQMGRQREAREILDRWQAGKNPAALDSAVEEYFFIVRWSEDLQYLNRRLKDGLRLAALPKDTSIPKLRADLVSADTARQRDAARALGLFGPAAAPAVPELVAALQSGSAVVRKEAAVALGRIGPAASAAIPALEALQDGSLVGGHVRQALALIRAE